MAFLFPSSYLLDSVEEGLGVEADGGVGGVGLTRLQKPRKGGRQGGEKGPG